MAGETKALQSEAPASQVEGFEPRIVAPNVRIARVPCSARIDPKLVLKCLEAGMDGVLVSGCHPGDCHYTEGNYYARRRMLMLRKLLEFVGFDPRRFQMSWVSASEGAKWAAVVAQVTEDIKALGPNRW